MDGTSAIWGTFGGIKRMGTFNFRAFLVSSSALLRTLRTVKNNEESIF